MSCMDEPSDPTQYSGDGALQDGISLARLGEHEQARAVFRGIIQRNPEHEQAWLWLAWVAESREEARRILEEARVLLPTSVRIAEGLRLAADATQSGTLRRRAGARASTRPSRPGLLTKRGLVGAYTDGRAAVLTAARAATRAARVAAQPAGRALRVLRGLRLPTVPWARLRLFVGPLVSLLTVVALVLGIAAIRQSTLADAARVMAEVLPTPDPLAPPTPTADQVAEPLWQQAEAAATMADWPAAIEALLQIRELEPRSERVRRELAAAYYNRELELSQADALPEALGMFDLAVRADASCAGLLEERRLLDLYLRGLDAYWTKDWGGVVSSLAKVERIRSGYKDAKVMLGQGYYEVGVEQQAQRKWFEAVASMDKCLALLPDHAEAPLRLAELAVAITPPRRIEVSLSQFTTTLFEDDQPVRTFRVCHGRASAPTLPGRYEIKTKQLSAYGSAWDLDMPYWLGIYDAGGSENGFHALPILSSGATVWREAIGTRCSFGCIVMDTPDAEYLYDWADLGTVVYVRP